MARYPKVVVRIATNLARAHPPTSCTRQILMRQLSQGCLRPGRASGPDKLLKISASNGNAPYAQSGLAGLLFRTSAWFKKGPPKTTHVRICYEIEVQ